MSNTAARPVKVAGANVLRREFRDREEFTAYLKEQFPESDGPVSSFRGGRQIASDRLSSFSAARYAVTRNFLSGNVSQLSPYIRHGVLTLYEVFQQIVSQAGGMKHVYKFVQELAWRDYWQRLYFAWGNGVWDDREESKTGLKATDYAEAMPPDVIAAETQLACMDAFSTTLQREGYLHNHARMWFAAYLIHWRRIKWQTAAKWFLSHLLDGDPASNNLSWQWVASTFSSKPYIFNRENLERYTEGVFCRTCSSRHKCPFDKTYNQISSDLFAICPK